MLSPDYLLHISEGAEEIAANLHTEMLKQVVDRIMVRQARGESYILTASDKWRLESLLEAGFLRKDLEKDVAKYTKLTEQEVKAAFEDAGVEALDYDDEVYREAGISTKPLPQSPELIRIMQRDYDATMGEWSNFTRTTANEAEQAFINTCDTIYRDVMSGGVSYTDAFVNGINTLAATGLLVTYPSGHVDTIETATLRAVRTGISQATAHIQIARMDEVGVDLVLVSSHMGARPTHQVWQGQVYSRSGGGKYPDFVSSTGYGTGAGLCGWNCRHSFSPYFEGMGNPFERYDDPENKKLYEETQSQRRMESAIRKTKRKAETVKEALNKATDEETKRQLSEIYSKTQSRLKRQLKAYTTFCDEHDLRPLPERLKIGRADRQKRKVEAMNKPEPPSTEDINKQATQTLRNAYESHRITNATQSVPLSELPSDFNVIGADFGKMSVESAKAFADTISALTEEYDTPLVKIRTMTKDESLYNLGAFAFVNHNYTADIATLVINPAKCKDISKLTDRIKELSESGYCIKLGGKNAEKYVATHEFAHTIINLEQPLSNKTNWVGANYDIIRKARAEIKPIYNDYMAEVETLTEKVNSLEAQSMQALMGSDFSEMERLNGLTLEAYNALDAVKLSDYSLADIDEFFAEAFTNEKIGINGNKYGKRVMEVIDKHFRRV